MKIYTRRDSATAVLRKAGIDKADYAKYIQVVEGGFAIEDPRFPAVKKTVKKPAAETVVDSKKRATKKTAKPPVKVVYEEVTAPKKAYRVDANNITNTIKNLIRDGKTNKEIWEIIQPQFNMGEDKRHYPSWYRSQMKRKGELK